MEIRPLYVRFDDVSGLEAEFERNLRHGGTFIPKVVDFSELTPCDIVLVHPARNTELKLRATVVWVSQDPENLGVGIGIDHFTNETRETIRAFIDTPAQTITERAPSLQERLRGLSSAEQVKVARGNDVPARVMLERMYGKTVWEPILRNPRVTVPEVARIAKMGALPMPLFELIGQNSAWLRVPQVRRTLLSNPRTPMDVVDKILRIMQRSELRAIASQGIYSHAIRDKAKRLLQLG